MAFGKLPFEFSHLPLTTFQTYVNSIVERNAKISKAYSARNDSDADDGVQLVDVDELVRKGRVHGLSI